MSIFLPSRRSVLLARKPSRIPANFDVDAAAYIAAVEGPLGDNQTLETGVLAAINDFVVGCKADGIWNAIKASCILAGARTLSGALIPLAGTAPTNNNFVSGDYNRKTGLVGNGSTKYLNSNRNNNADPQDSRHLAVYATTAQTSGLGFYLGGRLPGANNIGTSNIGSDSSQHFSRSSCANATYIGSPSNGLCGNSRSSASSYSARNNSTIVAVSEASQSPASAIHYVFGLNDGGTPNYYTNARLAFYSIGESLDLAKLDARVTALITAFGAAIP